MIHELRYSNTNTYLIEGSGGSLMFDTGWAGTFPALCRSLGEKGLRLQDVSALLISHFHPDHMGIAQQIADTGAVIYLADLQMPFIHSCDYIFEKEHNSDFLPIDESRVRVISLGESRAFLAELGLSGELLHTPGHSEDSISLWLDKERALFVGDLAPLYELEMHKGTQTGDTWERLLKLRPARVYYGHAPSAQLSGRRALFRQKAASTDLHALVKQIMKLIDRGCSAEVIRDKTGADITFIQDAARMYVTHPGVSVQGILDRIEIKGR